jgi:hypothetical protein
VLESKYTTLLIGSEYKLFFNPSLCLTYTTTRYIHLVGRVNFLLMFKEIILLRERERERSVCAKLLIRSILVLLFSFDVPWKKIKKYRKKRNKKEAKNRARRQYRRGFVCVFFSFVRWCYVFTLVSRLASLAQSSRGPTYYRH